MRINNFGYLFKEGIRGIFLHGFMSFAAICVTVACLLIVGTFSSLMYNVNIMVEDLNRTNEILVYIDETLDVSQAQHIETQIRQQVSNVLEAKLKSRDQALEEFIQDHENDPAFSGVEAEDLRHRVVVTLIDNALIADTVAQISAITGVVKISAAYELAEGFSTLKNVLQAVSVVFIAVLLFVSLLIISNTVKLGMADRRDEIAIMKMVGATNGFIRLPFVVEGFTLGMVGAGISFGLLWLLYDWALNSLNAITTLQLITLQPFEMLMVPMMVIFAAAGLFVGVVGSWTSVRKFMNV